LLLLLSCHHPSFFPAVSPQHLGHHPALSIPLRCVAIER
jgi:hypothetical protein